MSESHGRAMIGVEIKTGDFVVALWVLSKPCKCGGACEPLVGRILLFRRPGDGLHVVRACGTFVEHEVWGDEKTTDEEVVAQLERAAEEDVQDGAQKLFVEVRSGDRDVIRSRLANGGAAFLGVKVRR